MQIVPRDAGWDTDNIADMLNAFAEDNEMNFEVKGDDIPVDIAQQFVDEEYNLREEAIDMREDGFAECRNDLVDDIIGMLIARGLGS